MYCARVCVCTRTPLLTCLRACINMFVCVNERVSLHCMHFFPHILVLSAKLRALSVRRNLKSTTGNITLHSWGKLKRHCHHEQRYYNRVYICFVSYVKCSLCFFVLFCAIEHVLHEERYRNKSFVYWYHYVRSQCVNVEDVMKSDEQSNVFSYQGYLYPTSTPPPSPPFPPSILVGSRHIYP